jgi:CubicO group peptidase (beta-lactamase class C family)
MTRVTLVCLAVSGWRAQAQTAQPAPAPPEAQKSAAAAGTLAATRREALHAAPPASDDVSEKIRAFEAGLIPPLVFEGEPIDAKALTDRMAELKVPGVSIAVIDKGRIAWAKGYGLRESGCPDPVTPETLFQAASISKPVCAVGVMVLADAGKFFLDEDANEKLRSWHVPGNILTQEARVTMRRLLSHTAGLTVHGFRGYAAGEPRPTLIQVLNGEKPANSAPIRVDILPGSVHRDSGGGYTVLQQLVEDVTGREFPAAMRDLVLAKIGMNASTYEQPLPEGRRKLAATGHGTDGKPIPGRWHTYPEIAAAGLWTTPSDLARFAIELQNALRGESNRVLSAESVRVMITPVADNYGLGFAIHGSGDSLTFEHGGSNQGFKCTLVAFASAGKGAVVMTNGDQGEALAQEIVRTLARIYGWPVYQRVQRKAANVQGELKALSSGPRAVSGTGPEAASRSALVHANRP